MIKSLLVGLDESKYTPAATKLGIAWAKRFQCQVAGVAVVYEPLFGELSPPPEPIKQYASAYERIVNEVRDRCEALLNKFQAEASAAGVKYKLVAEAGLPADRIMVESQCHDVVLLGQETRFHFEAADRSCRTLQRLLRNPPRPVVAVPIDEPHGTGALVAYDGSVAAARTLQALVGTGLLEGQPAWVLSIDRDAEKAAQTAARAVEFLGYHGVQAEAVVQSTGDPAGEVILREARQRDVAMIAMGAFGHRGIAARLFGSATSHLLQHTTVPLFLDH